MSKTAELLKIDAANNLHRFGNQFAGSGIAIGLDETGQNLVQVATIKTLTNDNGALRQNRVFEYDSAGHVYVTAVEQSGPALIEYSAMREVAHGQFVFAVTSNGTQTDTLARDYAHDAGFHQSLERSNLRYINDSMPRLTACSYWDHHEFTGDDWPVVRMALHRKSPFNNGCERFFFEKDDCLAPGFGYGMTTHSGEPGLPRKMFHGEPFLLPFHGSLEQLAKTFWNALDPMSRVSQVVKFIPKKGLTRCYIINRRPL